MLCSKSSKWLNRLRSSRGFPDSDHINLEHFLSNSLEKNDPQTSADPPLIDKRPTLDKRDDSESQVIQGREVINNVLSELFQMGEFEGFSRIQRKKSCRKQQFPRICVVSTNSNVQNSPVGKERAPSPSPAPLPLTLSNRRTEKEVNRELKATKFVEEEEKAHWDLSGYSQTEVTVIDTSVPSWKFEKVLYRRKNVWKLGDKKGKGLNTSDRKKKRKEILNENGEAVKKKSKLCSSLSKSGNTEEGGEKKKKKKKKKKLQMCNSSKYVDKEESMAPLKSAPENEQDNSSQLQEKSSFKKQIDGGSSVILIKSIPTTNKKDISGIIKTGMKSMQK